MNTELIAKLFKSFEAITHREGVLEYWLAHELQRLLGYKEWRNFAEVIERARSACEQSGHRSTDHFGGAPRWSRSALERCRPPSSRAGLR